MEIHRKKLEIQRKKLEFYRKKLEIHRKKLETRRKKLEIHPVKKAKRRVPKGRFTYRPLNGTIFNDPNSGTKYILQKVIGTCDSHFIYKACYYTVESILNDNILLPTGYATVKYIQPAQEVFRSKEAGESIPNSNIIHIENWCIRRLKEGFCVALPHMSEGSLRYILSTRFHNGLPEDCIAIALKQALLGLFDLHNLNMVHKRFSTGSIYVNFKPRPISNVEIKLGFAITIYESDLEPPVHVAEGEEYDDEPEVIYIPKNPAGRLISDVCDLSPPEVFNHKSDDNLNSTKSPLYMDFDDGYTVKSDIWLVGIAALELAYGNLKISNRKEFEVLIKEIKKSKRLPDKLEEIKVEKGKGKMKKAVGYVKDKLKLVKGKRNKKFSKDFGKLVLDCLSTEQSIRPSVEDLLNRPFFQNAKDLKWFQRRVLYAKDPIPIADYSCK